LPIDFSWLLKSDNFDVYISKPFRTALRRPYAHILLASVGLASLDIDLVKRARSLQRISRGCFAWTTTQPTRWWEYPWVAREVERRLQGRRLSAADFGAGKSPLPVALQGFGLRTAVVDPDSQAQTGRRMGGEWDWIDYRRWGIATYRAGIEDAVFDAGSLGVAVSVSVIEHLPAASRRRGLGQVADALEPGGVLVLTVDLVRGTPRLWNRILAAEVEPPARHGTIDDLIGEAEAVALHLDKRERCRSRPEKSM